MGHKVRSRQNSVKNRHYALLTASNLFNASWYLTEYPDVAAAGMDPVFHYLHHGAAEGRSPGPEFDTSFYLAQCPEAAGSGLPPLLHYLLVGRQQELLPRPQWSAAPWWLSLPGGTRLSPAYPLKQRIKAPAPAVIIPVFNAVEELTYCLDAVLSHTPADCRIIIIDDASTDAAVPALLARYHRMQPVECHRNVENLGFTRTANKGIELAGTSDVVLLNADTQVTPGWLTHLQTAVYSREQVATVTPFSNNAGAFSAPKSGQNAIPPAFDLDRFARAISQASLRYYPEVPTGNGFCLYIRRACLNEVGSFDERAFPRGYGEENDFCMRARAKGWIHLIDDATYIYHVRSASFGDEKMALVAAGRKVIDERYPDYTELVKKAFSTAELRTARDRVAILASVPKEHAHRVKPRVLYVISSRTGGTPQTNQDLMQALAEQIESFVLHCNSQVMTLFHFVEGVYTEVARYCLAAPVTAFPHHNEEYDEVVARWLLEWSIELIHIRHIAWHSLGLIDAARALRIPRIFSFHDYYTVCPTVKLLDEQQHFCGGQCTAGTGHCPHELWPEQSFTQLKHGQVKEWQRVFAATLSACNAFVTTTEAAKAILLKTYPELSSHPFAVIAHGRNIETMIQLAQAPQAGEPLRMVVPGHISPAKGGLLIQELARLAPPAVLQIHILGNVSPQLALPNTVTCHGEYRREQFADKIAVIRPHVGAVLSIWPETWCHTLTELWAAGVPVVGLNVGAVGERLKRTGAGWLVEDVSAAAILSALQSVQSHDEWLAKQSAVLQWQQGEGQAQTCTVMAQRYFDLYQRLWNPYCVNASASE